MARITKRALAATAGIVMLSTTLAACGGDEGDNGDGPGGTAGKGGTLYVKAEDAIEHLDPHRTYIGLHINMLARTVTRGLLTQSTTDDPAPIPDIATDTGTMAAGGKEWSFTIRDDVKWEDGEAVTCEDFRYGYSRNFATDVITGGPSFYPLSFTDIPGAAEGAPEYSGPYTEKGQDLYDKAVTCDGNTITYRFNKSWPDFNLAVAALHFAAPYRADQDKGDKSNLEIFSNGPYKLEGEWDKESGGTLVQNENYGADDTGTRKALPDKIVFQLGDKAETTYEEIIADAGPAKTTISFNRLPASMFSQIGNEIPEDRYLNVASPFIDYLWFNTEKLDPALRQALAVSTDREAWINASGGERSYKIADSIINPNVPGYAPNSVWKDVPPSGDADQAKTILEDAGIDTPVKVSLQYPQSEGADKQAAALQDSWNSSGLFEVELKPEGDVYYTNIQKPDHDYEIGWAGWGADWNSPSTVLPPLFDSRANIQGGSLGQDYGKYRGDEFNKKLDEASIAAGAGDDAARDKAYQEGGHDPRQRRGLLPARERAVQLRLGLGC
ncbi:ABC transporter substrate-binding protein [Nocardioides speluncae]|uniref:ABC transporter substrate-binding protein n=1 Tax=Nocardioides speluncae TaxID=2670337 RepID=UPI00137A6C3D|nr:ABC transporter substrate-binding protein [Nocardioides speluncae]